MPNSTQFGADATQDVVDATTSVRRQVRGSALLLSGRGCSIALNLLTQILIVRSLVRTEYGQLAFAISIIEMLALGTAFSLDKSLARFGAIYHEQKDRPRLAGSLVLCGVIPLGLGLVISAALRLAPLPLMNALHLDDATSRLLLLAAILVPASAFASVTMSLLTVVHGAGAVFYRKHLLGPALKLLLVLGVVFSGGGAVNIMLAFVAAGVCGLLTDVWLLIRLIFREELLLYLAPQRIVLPTRELFSFCIPLLISDLAYFARGTLVVVLLGWLGSAEETASFRAVLPIVKLNELVIVNFAFMFTPLASRLFAQGNIVELWDVYRRTNLWIMVLSFPIFAGCVCLAAPLTVVMFGEVYHDSALLLVVLSYAYFLQAMLGFNSRLMKVLGLVKALMVTDIAASAITLAAVCIATPVWGPLGAALAASGGIILHCLLKSLALRWSAPEESKSGSEATRVLTFCLATTLVVVSVIWTPGWILGLSLSAAASLAVLWISREQLQTGEMFPELARLPGTTILFGTGTTHRKPSSTITAAESNTPRIAYMMSRFPKLTETFILREMIEMERLGCEVGVYPLQSERCRVVHPEVEAFLDRACFTPIISWRILLSNLRCLIRRPLCYFSTCCELVRANFGSVRYLTGALLFFPKAVYLGQRMKKDGIQHLHAHFASHPAMAAWVIHRLTGLPYSFTAHGSDLHRDQHMLREKVLDADFVAVISDYNRKLIIDHCGTDVADEVHVVHCGIDPSVFPRRVNQTAFDRGQGPLQLICVGTLHAVKGQEYLLYACHQLRQLGCDLICHFVGDGPDRFKLESLTREFGLTNAVRFHGKRTSVEIHELMAECDLIVAPSVPTRDGRREGIPVVLMEGMGTGLTAVASDLSGIPELVRHEQTGLLSLPGDAMALANAIQRLMGDAPLRARLAAAGHQLVAREFASATNAKQLLDLMHTSLHPQSTLCATQFRRNFETSKTTRQEEPCLV